MQRWNPRRIKALWCVAPVLFISISHAGVPIKRWFQVQRSPMRDSINNSVIAHSSSKLYMRREKERARKKRKNTRSQVIAIPIQRSLLSAHSSWQLTAITIFVRRRNTRARANTIMGGVLPRRGATKIIMEHFACNYDLLRSFEWLYKVWRMGKRYVYDGNTLFFSVCTRDVLNAFCHFIRKQLKYALHAFKSCISKDLYGQSPDTAFLSWLRPSKLIASLK